MRTWVAEGRVAANSLVWRAGWPDWCLAVETFPQLAALVPPAIVPSNPGVPIMVTPVASASATPAVGSPVAAEIGSVVNIATEGSVTAGRSHRPHRKRKDGTIVVSGILAALVLILFVILGIVLWQQGGNPHEETQPSPKPRPTVVEETEAPETSLDDAPAASEPAEAENGEIDGQI